MNLWAPPLRPFIIPFFYKRWLSRPDVVRSPPWKWALPGPGPGGAAPPERTRGAGARVEEGRWAPTGHSPGPGGPTARDRRTTRRMAPHGCEKRAALSSRAEGGPRVPTARRTPGRAEGGGGGTGQTRIPRRWGRGPHFPLIFAFTITAFKFLWAKFKT